MASNALVDKLIRQSLLLEYSNAEIFRSNLAKARKELKAKLIKDPALFDKQFQLTRVLDEINTEVNAEVLSSFSLERSYKRGLREGKTYFTEDAKVPANSVFRKWVPILPINAIGLQESLLADKITQVTDQLKKNILREVQLGLTLQSSNEDIARRILGTGVKGITGKDGVFRTSTLRAETIGRTVTNDLINRGSLLTYEQIATIVPEIELQKLWQTVGDRRTSDRCLSLRNQRVNLNEDFLAGDGWSGSGPPSHPNCRSRVTSVSKNYRKEWDQRFNIESPPEVIVRPNEKLISFSGLPRNVRAKF